jgi:uncharacterized protein YggU (UPF0235/DUF167 family)
MSFWRAGPDGVSVEVKAQTHARRPGVLGTAPGSDGARLRIAVREPAEDGRANEAVCATLAHALDLPRAAVSIMSGGTSRQKRLRVAGDPADLARRLAALDTASPETR